MALRNKQVTYSERPTRAARAAHAKGDSQFRSYDVSAIQPRRKPWGRIIGAVAVAVVLVLAAIVAMLTFNGCSGDVQTLPAGQTATIEVTPGEGARDIADSLVKARLIPNAQAFLDEVKRTDAAASLIPGTYPFEGGTSVAEIVYVLTIGPSYFADTLSVPEGTTRKATAEAVAAATDGRISAQQFLDATDDASAYAGDYRFLATAGASSLEGFLFPKTYTITTDATADTVVRMMLDQFATETAGLDWAVPEAHDLDLYGAVTLASIVEKEGLTDNYREVASVFYNRLAIAMPLQSDATTAYEVGHDPTADEVHADTPYSTYSNYGLPPTPICSPGLATLKAVCSPATTGYYYFYFVPDGKGGMSYHFSETYEDHQDAIASN